MSFSTLGDIPKNLAGSLSAFKASVMYFHPLFSIYYKFDYRIRRLTRLAILMIQTNLIAILIGVFTFKLTHLGGIFDRQTDYILLIAMCIGFLTFPIPECLIDILRARIMTEKFKY